MRSKLSATPIIVGPREKSSAGPRIQKPCKYLVFTGHFRAGRASIPERVSSVPIQDSVLMAKEL
jgi:hypothetical protein